MKRTILGIMVLAMMISWQSNAQFFNTKEELVYYTQEWNGERFEDGRPKIPQDLLDRLEKVSIEEAW